MYIIGIDLGGTNTKIMLLEIPSKLLIYEANRPTPDLFTPADLYQLIDEIVVKNNIAPTSLEGLAISFCGPVNQRELLGPANIRTLENTSLSIFEQQLKKKYPNIKVTAENDANAGALGIYLLFHENHRRPTTLSTLTLGTGIGGATIQNGRLIRGHKGTACEFGLMPIAVHQPSNQYTLFHKVVGPQALEEAYSKKSQQHLTVNQIFKKAADNDSAANQSIDEISRSYAFAMGVLIAAFNPKYIYIHNWPPKEGKMLLKFISYYLIRFMQGQAAKLLPYTILKCSTKDQKNSLTSDEVHPFSCENLLIPHPIYPDHIDALERHASAKALLKTYLEMIHPHKIQTASSIDSKVIYDQALKGDQIAISAIEEITEYLAFAITNITTLFGTTKFHLIGGLANMKDYLLSHIETHLKNFGRFYSINTFKHAEIMAHTDHIHQQIGALGSICHHLQEVHAQVTSDDLIEAIKKQLQNRLDKHSLANSQ